jgi:hypothetical protein
MVQHAREHGRFQFGIPARGEHGDEAVVLPRSILGAVAVRMALLYLLVGTPTLEAS